jgi:hypothetical protein
VSRLNPVAIFGSLCRDIPEELRKDMLVTGSLAAAYAYRAQLQGQAVNTKDADLLIHPAGNTTSAQKMANRLLEMGWRPTDRCKPLSECPPNPESLDAIRLMPPASNEYFIEFLNLPETEQPEQKKWIPVRLATGWYGLPSFRFMGLLTSFRQSSELGIEYAAPEMMALANLLSHPVITELKMESGDFGGIPRCAKDLGRVLALARLARREETENWPIRWRAAMQASFPRSWREHALRTRNGLRELLADDSLLEQARVTTDHGLLSGMSIDIDALRGIGERLIADAIQPFEEIASQA